MNSMTFNCPSCSQPLSLPPAFAGPQVQCPSCQTVIPLPNAPQTMALTPLAAQPLAPAAAAAAVSMAPPAVVVDKDIEQSIGKMSIETTEHTGEMTPTRKLFLKLTEQVSKIFIGQDELVLGTLVSLFSSGHVLIESVPGLGKTLFVRVLGFVLLFLCSFVAFCFACVFWEIHPTNTWLVCTGLRTEGSERASMLLRLD